MEIPAHSPTPMTLTQAIELAGGLLGENRLAEAERVLASVLQADPNSPDGLHFMGLLRCQQGRTDESIALIRQAVEVAPTYAEAHHNLGNILRSVGRPQEAIEALSRAMAISPDLVEAHLAIADILRRAGRRAEAVQFYVRAIALQPTAGEAYFQLGKIYYRLGKTADAEATFAAWQKVDPCNPVAAHMVAAIGSAAMPDRASDGYLRQEFDDFADTFDDVMQTIGYNGPQEISAALTRQFAPDRQFDILDAGCGTGLVGAAVRPWARHLTGVDVSPVMFEHARARGCYDRLELGELTSYLQKTPAKFDAVVSADTFIYFGSLSGVFHGVAHVLRPSGYFLFTAEHLQDASADRFHLQPSGRYSHRESYLRQCLQQAGLKLIHMTPGTIRLESGQPVAGLTVTAAMATDAKTG